VNAHSSSEADMGLLGHNTLKVAVTVEVRLFNSLHKYGGRKTLTLSAGSSVGDILERLGIPADKIYLALRNGRDITPSLYSAINTETALDERDVIALSGPVPYSWGYGAAIG
jgi:hypothetical protein